MSYQQQFANAIKNREWEIMKTLISKRTVKLTDDLISEIAKSEEPTPFYDIMKSRFSNSIVYEIFLFKSIQHDNLKLFKVIVAYRNRLDLSAFNFNVKIRGKVYSNNVLVWAVFAKTPKILQYLLGLNIFNPNRLYGAENILGYAYIQHRNSQINPNPLTVLLNHNAIDEEDKKWYLNEIEKKKDTVETSFG